MVVASNGLLQLRGIVLCNSGDFYLQLRPISLCNKQRTCPSLAEELSVHENTIYKWIQQYKEEPEQAFPGSGNLKPDADELRKAQRKIKELENEVAILKQAAVYFAKDSK